nr:unnamed protein product [Spirometra erinaceieuropaei]
MKRKYYGFHRSTIYKRIAREKKAYYARMADPSVPSTSSVVDQPPEIEMPELVPEVCTEPVDISEDAVADKCFLADLREFCLEAQMPLSTTKKLFRMLRPYHPEVPKDPRTLLQTPRTCISKPLNKGNYVHLGLERGLLDKLHSLPETSVPEMRIQLHIDGMKIFKGSNQGLWPILARVRHPVVGQPFIVGVFSGPGKPDPLDDFLGDCVGELKDLLASGLHIPHTQNSVKVILDNVICDTPARCFVRQVKAHNGYYGCDRCSHMGKRIANRMTFPVCSGRLRDDRYVRRQTSDSDDDDEPLYRPRQLLGWPTPPRILQMDEQMPHLFSQSSHPTPSTSYRHQAQSDTNDVNFRLASLENKVDFLAEQMVALNNSVRQLQATMTDAVSALERGATAADVGPSRLHLPLCTAEAYEDFVRRLTTEAELADKAVCVYLFDCSQIRQLAVVGGRSEKDFVRNRLAALIGPPLCYTFCWRGGSKEKRSFLACPLFSIGNDAIGQNPRFSNCNREPPIWPCYCCNS